MTNTRLGKPIQAAVQADHRHYWGGVHGCNRANILLDISMQDVPAPTTYKFRRFFVDKFLKICIVIELVVLHSVLVIF